MLQPAVLLKRPAGTVGPVITVESSSYDHDVIDPADASGSVSFNSDGTVTKGIGNTGATYNWRTGGGAGVDFDIYFETSGGSPSTGTTDAWLPLSANRELACVRTAPGVRKTWSGIAIIRRHSDFVEMARAAIAVSGWVEAA
jgi:hypothetical protein